MKTNFLGRKVTYSLLFAIIFLTIGTTPIFSQVQVEIQTDHLVENGTDLPSGDNSTQSLPYGTGALLRGFHSKLTLDYDPNNPNLPTSEPLPIDTWEYPYPNPFYEVGFQYGIEGTQQVLNETGQLVPKEFSKRYSIKYYLNAIYNPDSGQAEYKYYRKFYYNKGHVNLAIGDEIHILYHETSHKYMLYHVSGTNKTLLECEAYKILQTPTSYVSRYGRYNTPNGNALVTHLGESLFDHLVSFWLPGPNQDQSWLPILLNLIETNTACELPSPCSANYEPVTYKPTLVPGFILTCAATARDGNKESDTLDGGNVNVYPNPTNGMTNIELNSPSEEAVNIQIVDLTGKLVQQKNFEVTKGINLIQFDIASVPAGIYYVKIDSKYQFETKKVILIK